MIEEVLTDVLDRRGISCTSQPNPLEVTDDTTTTTTPSETTEPCNIVMPRSFVSSTRIDTVTAWRLWWFGNEAKRYPPLRDVDSNNIPPVKNDTQKRFGDYRRMMLRFEIFLHKNSYVTENMTYEQADTLLDAVIEGLNLYDTSANTNEVRPHQRSWRTVERKVPKIPIPKRR